MSGKINIDDENEFELSGNVVADEISIGSKNKFTL